MRINACSKELASRLLEDIEDPTFSPLVAGLYLITSLALPLKCPCRYDHLIKQYAFPRSTNESLRAVALQISLEKISQLLAKFQSENVESLVIQQKSFGYWSPKRCDVYVISHQRGHLKERLELIERLWTHGIKADLMYDSVLEDGIEGIQERCIREGISCEFTLRPFRYVKLVYYSDIWFSLALRWHRHGLGLLK